MSGELLVSLLVLLPVAVAVCCLALKSASAQKVLLVPAMAVLMVVAAILAMRVLPEGPLAFTPSAAWDNIHPTVEEVPSLHVSDKVNRRPF